MRYEQIGQHLFGTVWPRRWNCWGWLVVLAGLGWGMASAKEVSVPENVVGKLPLYFVENRGQAEGKAAYHTLGGGSQAYFTSTGVWLTQTRTAQQETAPVRWKPSGLQRAALHQAPSQRWTLKLEFIGARAVTPRAEAPAATVVSYFRGKPEQWRTGLATYNELVYPDLWSGIDLRYSGDKSRLKSTFKVKPGADPRRIRLAWRGAERVALTDAGRLRVETPLGIIEEERPVAWQERDGQRMPVSAGYVVEADPAGGWRHGFDVGSYDAALPLVIDPITLGYAGFLGGGGYDEGKGIAVDDAGAAYVTGYTDSSDFPTFGGLGAALNGSYDAFVVKVKPDGSGLVYASFLGGNGFEKGYGIAVDDTGAAYVTGETDSDDFPTVGELGTSLKDNNDAFVVKVKPDGSGLVYAGFLGGVDWDVGSGIAVDGAGAAYVTGFTFSSDFPTVGGLGASPKGGSDVFVAKVKPDGSGLDYAGFLGGSSSDGGFSIAVDGADAAYVTGTTYSSDFPTAGGLGVSFRGPSDVFVAKVKPDGSGLDYAGFLGGTGDPCYPETGTCSDSGYGIAVDGAGAAYVTGHTASTDFPTVGGLGASLKGSADAFVAKVKPDGSGLVYAGFLGGGAWDSGSGIAVDGAGAAYVTGHTASTDFPTVGGLGALPKEGDIDVFVAKVKPDGSGLVYAGFLGGGDWDSDSGIAVDGAGAAYVTGYTTSANFPTIGGLDASFNGDRDAFVAKIVETAAPTPPIAVMDRYVGYNDQPFAVAAPGVLRNDLNSDGGTLTASVVDAPGHGALRLDADGGFAYTPEQGYSGADSFTYKANNSAGDSAPATVTLELMQPPEAVEDRFKVRGGWSDENVLANDTNIIEGVATAAVKRLPRHGRLTLEPNGDFFYMPERGYRGRDSFTYAIKYGSSTSKPARVTLLVRQP